MFAADGKGVRRVPGAPRIATGIGAEEPVVARVVNGQVELLATDSPPDAPAAIAWYDTTMAHLAGSR